MDTKKALPTSPRDKPRPNPVSTIAEVLKTIMAEIASSPNMRAIARAQTLLDLMAEMQAKVESPQMNQGGPANALRQAEVVQKLETRVAGLEASVKTHEASMRSLESGIKSGLHVVDVNSAARTYNLAITRTKEPFHPLKDGRNRYITEFPANGDELYKKTSHELNNLLKVFGLETSNDPSGSEQRKRFLEYIGAVQLAKGGW